MELKHALFAQPDVSIYQVDREQDLAIDYLHWEITPIHAPTLAAESVCDGILDGFFILKAAFVLPNGEIRDGYIDMMMPERLSETAYFLDGGDILQIPQRDFRVWGVPLVAIEKFGNCELFYSKVNPEIGLEVLRKGLAVAKNKEDIAADMAYILRDEKRYRESLEAFTVAIEAGEAMGHANEQYFQYYYHEREALLKKLGGAEARAPSASD